SKVLRISDGTFRTGFEAVGAEQATSQIQAQRVVEADRVGRAGIDALAAPVGTLPRVHDRQTSKSLRQRRRSALWPGNRPLALTPSLAEDFQHRVTLLLAVTGRARNTIG